MIYEHLKDDLNNSLVPLFRTLLSQTKSIQGNLVNKITEMTIFILILQYNLCIYRQFGYHYEGKGLVKIRHSRSNDYTETFE